jgi:hypothetical protein
MNQIAWAKPDPVPNALHTAFTHAHETLIWASRGKSARHTFNYDLINSPNPNAQVSSVWCIPTVPRTAQATMSGVSVSGCSTLTHKGAADGEHCNVRARLDQPFAGHGRHYRMGLPERVDGYSRVDPFARVLVIRSKVRWYPPPLKMTRRGESELGALHTLELL